MSWAPPWQGSPHTSALSETVRGVRGWGQGPLGPNACSWMRTSGSSRSGVPTFHPVRCFCPCWAAHRQAGSLGGGIPLGTSVCPPEARVSASPWPVQGRLGSLPLPSTRNWDDGRPVTVPQGRREPPRGGRPGEGQGGRGGRELRPSCERLHGHERACPHLHRWQGLGDGVEGLLPQEGGGPGRPADGEGQGRPGDGPGGHGLQGSGGGWGGEVRGRPGRRGLRPSSPGGRETGPCGSGGAGAGGLRGDAGLWV